MNHSLSNLDNLSGAEIVEQVRGIPGSVTSLDLSLNCLGDRSGAELVQAFAVIPMSVTSLDLSYNRLGNRSGAELAQIFATISASVTSLNLDANDLYNKSVAELTQAFTAIPNSVTTLTLGDIELDITSNTELLHLFAAIPASVTSLHAKNLGNKSDAELAPVFAVIPTSVTSLDLSFNHLGYTGTVELAQAFAVIPMSVTFLNLRNNALDYKSAKLIQIFAAIPASVTSLDLGDNELYNKSGAELAKAFAAIPVSVISLGLGYNQLYNKSHSELIQIFEAIPANVTELDLRGNFINRELLDVILGALPLGVEKIILDKKTINMNEYVEHLLVDVAHLTGRQGMARFAFEAINPAIEIDEKHLNRAIKFLEKQNNPIADLTCGLLLEGRIKTTADILEDCEEFDNHIKKRTHDAISFYSKSANDPTIKSIAEFLLWDMKITCPIESVKNRLDQYEVTPNAITTINFFNKESRQGIITPLLASFGVFSLSSSQQNTVKVTTTFTL